ncbi:MAG: hypothetical protein ACLFWH_06895 [Actinomycetota bacterium]
MWLSDQYKAAFLILRVVLMVVGVAFAAVSGHLVLGVMIVLVGGGPLYGTVASRPS